MILTPLTIEIINITISFTCIVTMTVTIVTVLLKLFYARSNMKDDVETKTNHDECLTQKQPQTDEIENILMTGLKRTKISGALQPRDKEWYDNVQKLLDEKEKKLLINKKENQ